MIKLTSELTSERESTLYQLVALFLVKDEEEEESVRGCEEGEGLNSIAVATV